MTYVGPLADACCRLLRHCLPDCSWRRVRFSLKTLVVSSGVDPKSIVCEYYRRGQCAKGFKCKFSHDLSVERKGEKIDLYSDRREEQEEGELSPENEQFGSLAAWYGGLAAQKPSIS